MTLTFPLVATQPLSPAELRAIDAYWRAANYLSVGQIYLLHNALLAEPLRPEHIKPRLLGHWGTTPGLNFIYAHLNRVIRQRNLSMMYVIGPGHGGPAIAANTWLEGSYTETYPDVTRDADGMERLFRQFSFPGGIPSHVAPELPGSIHEGGELGYSLSHAYGAAFDTPDLIVACVIGDGEAETGPLAASWHSNKFLDPRVDGVVLPILHLNGYKIANPTVLARIGDDELTSLLEGYGYGPFLVEGDEPPAVHQALAATLDQVLDEIAAIQAEARGPGGAPRPRWPMIVLRTPKGWTGPRVVDGVPVEGTWRAHQVPLSGVRTSPEHLAMLEQWLRSYRPQELFDADGRPVPELLDQAPKGNRSMGSTPHANGGLLTRDLDLPDLARLGFIDHVVNKKAEVVRVYLPPDTNTLLATADHCLRSRDCINVVVAGKQPQPSWLDLDEAVLHCARGLGVWQWASNDDGDPDVVLACAGDVLTLETLAAVSLLREHLPHLRIRVVNVVDLMRLQPASEHPHGLTDAAFDALFTTDAPIIFAYHGYPTLIHRLTYRRNGHPNLHVRGYKEEGTTTTPFDMVVRNDLDRFHLAIDVIDRVSRLGQRAAATRQWLVDQRARHHAYILEHGEDLPEIRNWQWKPREGNS